MDKYIWLDEYMMKKAGATKDYKLEWEWHRYKVGEKMFAAIMQPGDSHNELYAGKNLINLKCDPLLAEIWRNEHPQVMPGFYSDKRTWNSIDLDGGLQRDLLFKMIDDSYELVFGKLTKKLQKEILDAEAGEDK